MLITNKERMAQLASALDSAINIIRDNMSERNLLETPVASYTNVTIGNVLHRMRELTQTIAGNSEDAAKYWANVSIPYTEDTFPVEH